jgi:hypothetical protein
MNPVGCANPNLAPCTESKGQCAMIYVFDNRENLGECCGCSLSPQKHLALSVETNLRANWLPLKAAPGAGTIDIVSAAPNINKCSSTQKGCNGGCYPAVTYKTTHELNGYILHDQALLSTNNSKTDGIPEVPLADAGDADPQTVKGLVTQYANLIGNGAAITGFCNCE